MALQGARGCSTTATRSQNGYWQQQFLMQWSSRIGGGTEQIQRNVIGERVLGLPGEPRVPQGHARSGSCRVLSAPAPATREPPPGRAASKGSCAEAWSRRASPRPCSPRADRAGGQGHRRPGARRPGAPFRPIPTSCSRGWASPARCRRPPSSARPVAVNRPSRSRSTPSSPPTPATWRSRRRASRPCSA